jgi:hypothetical protein
MRKPRGPKLLPGGRYSFRRDDDDISTGDILHPADAEVYAPRDTIPEAGAWAIITRQLPPLEGGVDQHLRVGRIFYVERQANTDAEGFMPDGRYKALSHTPWGTVHLWPYEYSVLAPTRVIKLWQSGMVFHPTHVEHARFTEISFYARSRGIPMADAAVMALGSFPGAIGWFEPPVEVADDVEAMADRINRWPWDDTKRKAAHARANL